VTLAAPPSGSSLSGVAVLELGDGWTVPLAGRLLADLGADVTKVEVPWGDRLREFGRDAAEQAATYALPSAGKTLMRDDAARARLAEGFAGVDVLLVEASAAQRLELDLGSLDARTIVCRFSPFDLEGPLADQVASDLTLQALSGVMATTGYPGGIPLRAGTELGSVLGALYGVVGTLAALVERERSGIGQVADVALHDCLVSTLTNFASRVLGGVAPLGRIGNQGPNSAPWELFETADDGYVFIIAASPPTFARLVATMGRPELLDDPRFSDPHRRRSNAEAITAVVADWARTLPRKQIVSLLRDNGVPVSPVPDVPQVLADEHLHSRGLLSDLASASGRVRPRVGQPLGFGRPPLPPVPLRTTPRGKVAADQGGPLAGVRVVDFGNLTAGPFCTRLLANLGADVLKIEPPQGEGGRHQPPIIDGESVFFHITNNGKRSLSVDLHEAGDVELVTEVIASADILVENQAPGALEKRGLGPDKLLATAPHLVYTSATGYGHEGALGGLRAYDTVIQAGAGLMSLTGEATGRPLKTGISTADVLGALAAATASLGAYFGRLTGRHGGVRLDVSLFDICAWSTQMAWVSTQSDLPPATRQGNGHWLHAPYGLHRAADLRLVAIACETEDQWRRLAAALGDDLAGRCPPDLTEWSRATRWARRDELAVLLDVWCESHTAADAVARLQRAGVPAGELFDVDEVITMRQGVAPTLVDTAARAGRSWRVTDLPIRLSATPGRVHAPGPPLGHENTAIKERPAAAWSAARPDDSIDTDERDARSWRETNSPASF
jgi:crotonobetainyl-CoA:carnitine CoA-transferase CaiB-like acyl-CoA transferase